MFNKKINVSTVIIGVLAYKLVKGYFVRAEIKFYKEDRVAKVKTARDKVKSVFDSKFGNKGDDVEYIDHDYISNINSTKEDNE